MTVLFWIITIVLTIASFAFVLPGLKQFSMHFKLVIIAILAIGGYTLYALLGASRFLPQYYSDSENKTREILTQSLRPNWTKLQKEKYKLIRSLSEQEATAGGEVPENWQLLQIQGLEALIMNNRAEARAYFIEALKRLPAAYQAEKQRLQTLIEELKD